MDKKAIILITVLGLGVGGFVATGKFSNPACEVSETASVSCHHDQPSQFKTSLIHYFDIQKALANDDLEMAKNIAKNMRAVVEDESELDSLSQQFYDSKSLSQARVSFEGLSKEVERLVIDHGSPKGLSISKHYCPMVDNNRGASWLQDSEKTLNPYFGSAMLHCGSKQQTL